MLWPAEYPLSHHELSYLLPYFLKEGRGKLDVYFTRVYNPVWTNPDGFSWIEVLTDEEKVIASALAKQAKADFVKTSTGFAGGGATVYDVALMRETVGPKMGVKAAGGIRTAEDVEEMIAAGATRIGASAGVKIVSGQGGVSGQY